MIERSMWDWRGWSQTQIAPQGRKMTLSDGASAEGAEYESQGQARSASPLVAISVIR